ncbi:MAG TPA: ABC transporter permease, partial [Haliscomenobacter sp.]|uniref:ABC transporter permease n=1 Tax=Haliscomenobacter sp. TaxID=2717303 RepID=UPI002C964178
VFLPSFNALTEKELSIQFGNPAFWGLMFVFTLFTGLLAGSYPALYLSSFSPLKILKGGFRVGKSAALPRKILIVVQFSFSIVLMIGTMIIYQQIQFVKNRPIGFNNQGLISVAISKDLTQNFEPLRNELLASGMVSSICKASSPASEIWSNGNGWEWRGSSPADKGTLFNVVATTYDYTQTMGIELKSGRDFSREFSTDATGVLLNEAAVKRMGLENPVGEVIKWNGKTLSVVGVIPNINMESPFQSISPLTIVFDKDWVECLCVRINPNVSSSEAIAKIGPIFDKYNPGFPFDYAFADAEYAKKFKYTAFIGKLSLIVSILAIFISCLGLFGLASFMAEQRTKEIGIRKVLGASVAKLWQSLSKDFVVLVLISCLIATPIAYYFMHEWLQKYTYRIEISWWVFAVAAAGALVITLLTVSYQAIKAALVNPVQSLKSE